MVSFEKYLIVLSPIKSSSILNDNTIAIRIWIKKITFNKLKKALDNGEYVKNYVWHFHKVDSDEINGTCNDGHDCCFWEFDTVEEIYDWFIFKKGF